MKKGFSFFLATISVITLSLLTTSCQQKPQNDVEEVELYPVQVKEKYGYIDRDGKMVIAPKFYNANNFQEGLAVVTERNPTTGEFEYGYINKDGEYAFKKKFKYASSFQEGMADVESDGKQCFIDRNGEIVLKTDFNDLGGFSEGLSSIRLGSIENGKYGFINTKGEIVVEPQYTWVGAFHDGIAPVKNSDNKWGFINKQGKMVIEPKYDMVLITEEGLTPVRIGDRESGKWGFIDKEGNFIVEPKYKYAQNFTCGLAFVVEYDSDKGGYINKNGEYVIEPEYYGGSYFSKDGNAFIYKGGYDLTKDGVTLCYIDKTGSIKKEYGKHELAELFGIEQDKIVIIDDLTFEFSHCMEIVYYQTNADGEKEYFQKTGFINMQGELKWLSEPESTDRAIPNEE